MSSRNAPRKAGFTTHRPPGSATRDVTIRISEIANGYVIKAGGQPVHCPTAKALRDAVADIAAQFAASK